MNTTQYLDAVKRKLGISSDYALAAALHLTRFGVSKLRRGHFTMSTTTAAKIAEILELEAIQVIADAELERGSSPELWKRIRAAAAWAAVAFGAACFGVPHDARAAFDITPSCAASGASAPGQTFAPGMRQKYTLRRIRRQAGAALTGFFAWLARLACAL